MQVDEKEFRKLRIDCGQFCILHPAIAEIAFGKEAVLVAENNHDGFLARDSHQDYYLGQKIPIKFIKNKAHGNKNKNT